MKFSPIPEEFRETHSYNPETGEIFRTKDVRFKNSKVNKKIETTNTLGYIVVYLKGKNYYAHRVAYYLHYGVDPGANLVDHINGDRTDNRIENLRLVDHKGNGCNRAQASGAYLNNTNVWFSRIKVNGEKIYLGTFKTFDEAHQAYLEAKRTYHPTCSHF